MDHVFLSDVHLGAFTPAKNQHLEHEIIELVAYCSKQNIKIHLLGDLFDYWMEFPGYTPVLGKKMLDAFQNYNRQITRASYITGNHDYWTIGHFEERGFQVEPEYIPVEIDEKQLFLFHGDGISDTSFNIPRPFLNSFLRNRTVVFMFQKLFSGKTGNKVMKSFSNFTRDENNLNPERLTKWAKEFLANSRYHYIISGHDHVARIETFGTGTYINCGAFYRDQTLAMYTNGGFELVVWNGAEKELSPY